MTKPAKPADPKPARAPDNFQLGRALYKKRQALFRKADALYEAAAEDVRRICQAQEEADANRVIEQVPSTPPQDQLPPIY